MSLFWIFLRLGCTSFGGPIAHLAYFRDEFVTRRQWFSEAEYTNLIALCQVIPGPASSQVGAAIGHARGGYWGALAAWLGFTLPSAVIMTLAAVSLTLELFSLPWLINGLKLAAVVIVLHAVTGMFRSLCCSAFTRVVCVLAGIAFLLLPMGFYIQLGAILLGAIASYLFHSTKIETHPVVVHSKPQPLRLSTTTLLLALCGGLFLLFAFFSTSSTGLMLAEGMYRSGGLVFGGGHVVLPLLHSEFVNTDWVTNSDFLAGYGVAQVLPGPLFTFASFIGAIAIPQTPIIGAIVATISIFLPGMLLLFALLPVWAHFQGSTLLRHSLVGINAVVVGLLAATLIEPIGTSAVNSTANVIIVLLASSVLFRFKWHPVAVATLCVVCSGLTTISL